MNRRNRASHFYHPYYAHQPIRGQFVQTQIPVPSMPQGCYVPQNYLYYRYPGYPPMSHVAYSGVPLPHTDYYRMIAPQTTVAAPISYPYYPSGVVGLPPLPQTTLPVQPARPNPPSFFDQLVAQVENHCELLASQPNENEQADGETATANIGNVKSRKSRNVLSRRMKRENQSSQRRPRYSTNFRRKRSRKQNLNKKSFLSRSSISANEVSSIRRPNPSDKEYETCDENEEFHYLEETNNRNGSDLFNCTIQFEQEKKWSDSATDYTIITNEKSYSYVNFNPDMLPKKLNKMWIEPRLTLKSKRNLQSDKFLAKPSKENYSREKEKNKYDQIRDKSKKICNHQKHSTNSYKNKRKNLKKNDFNRENDANNITGINQMTELWWDDSTDVGCTAGMLSPKKESSDCSQELHQTFNNDFYSFTKNFPESYDNPGICSSLQVDNCEMSESEQSQTLAINDLEAKTLSHYADTTKLNVAENKNFGSTNSERNLTKNFQSIEENSLSNSIKRPEKFQEHSDTFTKKTSKHITTRGEPCEDDDAIVAIIHCDLPGANNSSVNSDAVSCQKFSSSSNAEETGFETSGSPHIDEEMKIENSIESKLKNSITIANTENIDDFKLVDSCSVEPLKINTEQPVYYDRSAENRICTPHSKTYNNFTFSNAGRNKTFTLPQRLSDLNEAIDDKEKPRIDAGKKFTEKKSEIVKCNVAESTNLSEINYSKLSDNPIYLSQDNKSKLSDSFQYSFSKNASHVIETKNLLRNEINFKSNMKSKSNFFSSKEKIGSDSVSRAPMPKLELLKITPTNEIKASQNVFTKKSNCESGFSYKNDNLPFRAQKTKENLLLPGEENSVLTKYIEKIACSISNSPSNAISARPPPRRSPRNSTTINSEITRNNIPSTTNTALSMHNNNKLVSVINSSCPANSQTTVSYSSSAKHIQQSHNCFPLTKTRVVPAKTQNTFAERNVATFVPNTKIHSNILTKVNDLLICSKQTKPITLNSPGLVALQASGLNKKRANKLLRSQLSNTFVKSSSVFRTVRSSSVPTSPEKNRSSTINESNFRSISLSNVFFDSTADESLNEFGFDRMISSTLPADSSEMLSTSKLSTSALESDVKLTSKKSTYISYPYPSIPSSETDSKTVFSNEVKDESSFTGSSQKLVLDLPKQYCEPDLEVLRQNYKSNEISEPPSLDRQTENELQRSSRELIESVTNNQFNHELVNSNFHSFEASNFHSFEASNLAKDKEEYVSSSKIDVDEIKNVQTGTDFKIKISVSEHCQQNLINQDETGISLSKIGLAELNAIPEQYKGNILEKIDRIKSTSTKNSVLPVFPMLAVAHQTTRVPFFITPNFVSTNIGKRFIQDTSLPTLPWYSLSSSFEDIPQKQGTNYTSRSEIISKDSLTDNICNIVSKIDEKKNISRPETNSKDSLNDACGIANKSDWNKGSFVKSLASTNVHSDSQAYQCVLIPCNVLGLNNRPYRTLKRRRSFSGISSSVVAKARLNRHRLQLQAQYQHDAYPIKQINIKLNKSHPVPRQFQRRPRFIRNSLSGESVYELAPKPVGNQLKQAKHKKFYLHHASKSLNALEEHKDECDNAPDDVEVETGYSSAVSSEKESKLKSIEFKDDQPTTSNSSDDKVLKPAERITISNVSVKSKLLTLPRTLRKMLPGKKSSKNTSNFEVESFKTDANRNNLDLILEQKKGQPANFLKSKKLQDTDEESTLKGEYRLKTPNSLKQLAKPPASTTVDYVKNSPNTASSFPAAANTKPSITSCTRETTTGSPSFSLTDCSTGTIANQGSVNTPGARINSETGDVIPDDTTNDGAEPKRRQQQLLSSTAIDEN